ncbi:hypothetical protein LRS06_08230 [Hymenobacter sp. J193]|uniref:hypothetical protein n=1 Tax=Hymenobacter sp. J193 TaxID=2898429 RepID=UPI0021511C87|nr:hypothetical protein [Hymenobacter sp. J193]MCR5887766.1 hypothetical protein [Hymenobacter sp. J193]
MKTRRLCFLFALLLLLPGMAHADALDGAMLMLEIMAGLYGLAGLAIVVIVLAYRWSQYTWLRWVSWVLTGVAVLLGLWWQRVFGHSSAAISFLIVNPFLGFCLPLALWLNAVWYARRAYADWPRALGIAVGVLGLSMILGQTLSLGMMGAGMVGAAGMGIYAVLGWILRTVLLLVGWWIVLKQVQKYEPLVWAGWPQIFFGAAVYTGVVLAYSLLSMWLQISAYPESGNIALKWLTSALPTIVGQSLLSGGIGILMLWGEQRIRAGSMP